MGFDRQLKVLSGELLVIAAQRNGRNGKTRDTEREIARDQRRALQRVKSHIEHAANDLERLETSVGDQQRERERNEANEPRKRGRALLK